MVLSAQYMAAPWQYARVEGASAMQTLWRVYVPLARPVYTAFALVSVSFHWNNFLWPLIITNSVESRPLTVGLQVFSSVDQGVDWSIITAAPLMTSALLLTGSVAGAQVGARFASRVKPEDLRMALAVIVLLVAVRILLGLTWRPDQLFSVDPS